MNQRPVEEGAFVMWIKGKHLELILIKRHNKVVSHNYVSFEWTTYMSFEGTIGVSFEWTLLGVKMWKIVC